MDEAILGLDTSTAACSVCVVTADGQEHEVDAGPTRLFDQPAHAGELLPAIAQALAAAGISWDQLAAVAAGVGPGAFTGLRIGVATARGLASARGIPLIPVSSLEALAAELLDGHPSADVALPVIDAKRGELFVAAYARGQGRPRELVHRASVFPDALGDIVAGLGTTVVVAGGDGAVKHAEAISAAGVQIAERESPLHMVRARSICRLSRMIEGLEPTAVEPDYVREPDIDANVLAAIAAREQITGESK